MKWNLRHLRVFLATVRQASVSRAAELCHLSQPAASQALAGLEAALEQPLFHHRPKGLFPTPAGEMLAARVARALARLDAAAQPLAPGLALRVSTAQLQALIAVHGFGNFTLAARHLGLAQPTVHRAVTHLEREAGRALFDRSATGIRATRAGEALAGAARLAFAELDQAVMDLSELQGREAGQIVVGAMPLSRSFLLGRAIIAFRETRPNILLRIDEGPYADLLTGLRRGEIDFLIGALREPLPIGDVVQTPLFPDEMILAVGPQHPLLRRPGAPLEEMRAYPWIVARTGTPARRLLDRLFEGQPLPASLIETGSLVLMRQLMQNSNHIGFISKLQAAAEIELGLMVPLSGELPGTQRSIGITVRRDWFPTKSQQALLSEIRGAVRNEA
ncbi:LysR family transcriptional regulator [Pseudooceanicola sp. CBS1P-1]|uniref:LysR family transcriptional regulator n=1 Tax=Pseudooceanicola albus TaxID=2692189 RepID=A0A6L7G8Y2_9RHOB|nr:MULTISPECIES: LysR family transcriptional regulator [Pseudooceanicola]MBT9385795.1 LysR family transcriptional regulator [Pseudooceanicola endophyticus]MXN20027.1 LysR family transcriptional regulator [Pseudooceanicola albus]